MNEHQKEVALRMLQRARAQLAQYECTFEYAQDVDRWGEGVNTKLYERARVGILKYREKIAKLEAKLAGN
jgi:hypothetical protein